MNIFLYFKATAALLPLFLSCKIPNAKQKKYPSAEINNNTAYQEFTERMQLMKKNFTIDYKNKIISKDSVLSSIKNYWTVMIGDSLYSYWKGTSYEVYAKPTQPGNGPICSERLLVRFLSDIGTDIIENELAHDATTTIMYKLAPHQNVEDKSNLNARDFNDWIAKQGKGVYLIALGVQGAFLINDGSQNWIISNMFTGKGVLKEPLLSSKTINEAIYKKVINLTNDTEFIEKKWIKF
jgi:hypothetical protein